MFLCSSHVCCTQTTMSVDLISQQVIMDNLEETAHEGASGTDAHDAPIPNTLEIIPKLSEIQGTFFTEQSLSVHPVPSDPLFKLSEQTSIEDVAYHTKIVDPSNGVVVGICTDLLEKCCNPASRYFKSNFDFNSYSANLFVVGQKWSDRKLVSVAMGCIGEWHGFVHSFIKNRVCCNRYGKV